MFEKAFLALKLVFVAAVFAVVVAVVALRMLWRRPVVSQFDYSASFAISSRVQT